MRRFSKIPGVFQNANNGLFGGRMIKINGTWGCLLLFLLWPLLILVLLGTGLFLFLSSLLSRPRNLHQPDSSRPRPFQGQGDIIDVEVIRVDEDIPGIKTITIDPEKQESPEGDSPRGDHEEKR